MQPLYIELKPADDHRVELRYYQIDQQSLIYEPQLVELSEIQTLIDQSEQDFYVSSFPDLVNIGQQLFAWLDGRARYLTRGIDNCQEEGLILAIATGARLAHLPWEVLHDGSQFLIERFNPLIVPVRWTKRNVKPRSPQDRALRVLFMATSPEPPIEPVLEFEREEAQILDSTRDIPLNLQVEESGCLEELTKLWKRYPQDYFDVFHLTGHASIKKIDPNRSLPYFVTENIDGTRHDATDREIADALIPRFPQLVFLSGCRTGQAGNEGAVPSMAQELIDLGMRAVLGWGYPVADISATTAAAQLYSDLAFGSDLAQALSSTYRKLREDNVPDWHFLRLYVGGECPGAMVPPPGTVIFQTSKNLEIEDLFFDPDNPSSPRVVARENFVGRRRSLQRCLQHLRTAPGILIHGIGGVGKTTLAKRLLERLADYDIIYNHKYLDPDKLINLLISKCENNQGLEILRGPLPLTQKLTNFLKFGLSYLKQSFLFVLDDFEENLELNSNGEYIPKSEAIETLIPLLEAIRDNGLSHRVIITCRYNFKLPNPRLNERLQREQLTAFEGVDLRKKLDRLEAFSSTSGIALELQQKVIKLADGNPRLLEWLAKILASRQINPQPLLKEMENKTEEFCKNLTTEALKQQDEFHQRLQKQIEDKVAAFRENILAELLLARQSEELRQMLSLGLVFQLPVPRVAFATVCREIPASGQHIHRASDLGLLEVTPAKDFLRVPRILEPLLHFPSDSDSLYRKAAHALYQSWWPQPEILTEEQQKEIYRLAYLGQEIAIAVEVMIVLTDKWLLRSRYAEVKEICQQILTLSNDYRILYNLALAEEYLGEVDAAQEHIQEALRVCPPDDAGKKALIIALLAGLMLQKGQKAQTTPLYEQIETLGDVQGKAEALGSLAVIKSVQGDFEGAESYIQQALEIHKRLGNSQGIAQVLYCWAMVKTQQGLIEGAFTLYQQVIDIWRSLGKLQELANTLQMVGALYAQLGRAEEASHFLEEATNISQNIGETQSQIQALLSLGTLEMNQGHLNEALHSFEQARDLCERIGNNLGKSAILLSIGCIYLLQKQMGMAMDVLTQAVEMSKNTGNVGVQIQALLMLGQTKKEFIEMFIQEGYPEIVNHFIEARDLSEQIGSQQLKIQAIDKLVALYLMQGLEDDAIELYQQAVDTSRELGNVPIRIDLLVGLASILAKKEARKEQGERDFKVPMEYLQEALKVLKELDTSAARIREQQLNITEDSLIKMIHDVQEMQERSEQSPTILSNNSETEEAVEAVEALQRVAQLSLNQGNITKYQQLLDSVRQLQKLSPVVNCSACGAPFVQENNVCPYCSTRNLSIPQISALVPSKLSINTESSQAGAKVHVATITLRRGGTLTEEVFTINDRAIIGIFGDSNHSNEINLEYLPEAERKRIDSHHAEVWCDLSGQWSIRDLGSKNGTFIRTVDSSRWERIQNEQTINDGDSIALGNIHFEFRVV